MPPPTVLGSAFALCASSAGRTVAIRALALGLLALAGIVAVMCGFVCARRFAGAGANSGSGSGSGSDSRELMPLLLADFSRTARSKPLTGEERCRALLERWFRRPFPKVRPSWLINPKTGQPLELDCYNEELRLAVEFDGIQHAVEVPRFHPAPGDFEAQKYRDGIKDDVCERLGITLVRVPHTQHTPERLEPFLRAALARFLD